MNLDGQNNADTDATPTWGPLTLSDEIQFPTVPRKRPIKVGTVSTVDVQTEKVVSEKANAFTVIPPKHGCPECGTNHVHDQPHNQQSLVYQYQFYGKNGRWPTWTDAMAHCPESVRTTWRKLLVETMRTKGLPVPDDLNGNVQSGSPSRSF